MDKLTKRKLAKRPSRRPLATACQKTGEEYKLSNANKKKVMNALPFLFDKTIQKGD